MISLARAVIRGAIVTHGDARDALRIDRVLLNAAGGHPGNDPQHAAIRRWTAPRDAQLAITGALKHESDPGDGVRGRIVSSRLGIVGEWTVHHAKEQTAVEGMEVKRGDTIDFVVDCQSGPDSDSFSWAPTIKLISPSPDSRAALTKTWDAREDFSGPKETPRPLDAWEKFAQVLLLSNEAMFVD